MQFCYQLEDLAFVVYDYILHHIPATISIFLCFCLFVLCFCFIFLHVIFQKRSFGFMVERKLLGLILSLMCEL